MSYDYLYKCILVGDTNAGKTSYADRLVNNSFNHVHESTIGVDFRCKVNILQNHTVIKTHIWDTAGQEKFASIITNYYKGIASAVIFFDVGRRSSFERAEYWRQEIVRNRASNDPMIIMLVGNKIDRNKRVISTLEAEAYANKHNLLYSETSCKNDINVEESFKKLITTIYDTMDKENPGCGIKRSVVAEAAKNLNLNGNKGRDCYYFNTDKCPNCCTIV